MRMIQDSGIMWGLGSDATAVTTSNPFYNLWFAVTGKMIGGHVVNDVPPKVAIEQARRGVGTEFRPTRAELDQMFKEVDATA